MTYSDLFKIFERYTDDTEFTLLEVKISKIKYQGRDAYVFVHNNIQYFAIDNYDIEMRDEIQINLYQQVNKLLRKKKIANLLNEIL